MSELLQTEVINADNTIPEQPKSQESKPENNIASNPIEESPQDRDWRKWRENRQKEREESVRIDAARQKAEREAEALRNALEAVVNKPDKNRYSERNDNDDIEESEEARIDRRVAEALAKKEAEYERQRQERDKQEFPTKLRNTFKDFNQVCTAENLDYLEFHHPEVSKSLGRMTDGFDKWADIYSAIKRYIPNPESSKDAKKAEKNLQKPQSLSHSMTPNGTSNMTPAILTEQRRKDNWDRMQRTLKGLS